jgi:5'-3' exonuclease
MKKLIIFDADSIIFTVAWHFRTKKIPNFVKISTNKFVADVLRNSNADDYIGFFGAKSEDGSDQYKKNFRYMIDSNYKGNRPSTPDFVVKWRPTIHKEFKDTWGFLPVEGMEADDAVAITVEKHRDNYDEIIVATFDKDLRQIPDITFYNMKDHTMEKITKEQAAKNFYTQMLTGDPGDNIPGLKGIGKVSAAKILNSCVNEFGLFRTVVGEYKKSADIVANKKLTELTNEILEQLKDVEIDSSSSEYFRLSGPRLERKIRINSKQTIKDAVDAYMPGGWKTYFKQQYDLLKLLTKETEDIVIPDARSNPNKIDPATVNDSASEWLNSTEDPTMDNFLTI